MAACRVLAKSAASPVTLASQRKAAGMAKILTEHVDVDSQYGIEGLTANEFLAWAAQIVNSIPEQYRDAAKIVDAGYDVTSHRFEWTRAQTEAERQKEERDKTEREARESAERYERERQTFERLKAKFEPTK